MERDELIEEISRRKGIAMEEVAEILDEEDAICLEEEEKFVQQMKKKKRRKKMCMLGTITIFLAGAVCALFVLDKKEKISMSRNIQTSIWIRLRNLARKRSKRKQTS